MNADGSGQTPLVEGPDSEGGPVFSPDRTRLAFSRSSDGVANIFTAQATGQSPTPLTTDPNGFDFEADWQPLGPACELTGQATSKSFKQVGSTPPLALTPMQRSRNSIKAPKVPKGAVASKAKKFSIPPVTAQVPRGTPTTVTLKIPKKGQKGAKEGREGGGKKGKATITATLTDDLGESSSDQLKVKFKAKKK